jgi:glutamyl/glutaminyl-tRNA synthetase
MVNFLALLGWHPKDDQELMSREKLISSFDLSRVQKGGAVFSAEKLEWMNGAYLRALPIAALADRLVAFVSPAWIKPRNRFERVVEVERERLKKLSEFSERASLYFTEPRYAPSLLLWKGMLRTVARDNLLVARQALCGVSKQAFTRPSVDAALRPVIMERGRGEVLWPLRVALSGLAASPSPAELAYALGREETLRRLEVGIEKLSE